MENQDGGREDGVEETKFNAAGKGTNNESKNAASEKEKMASLNIDDCVEEPKLEEADAIARAMKQQRFLAKTSRHSDLILVGHYINKMRTKTKTCPTDLRYIPGPGQVCMRGKDVRGTNKRPLPASNNAPTQNRKSPLNGGTRSPRAVQRQSLFPTGRRNATLLNSPRTKVAPNQHRKTKRNSSKASPTTFVRKLDTTSEYASCISDNFFECFKEALIQEPSEDDCGPPRADLSIQADATPPSCQSNINSPTMLEYEACENSIDWDQEESSLEQEDVACQKNYWWESSGAATPPTGESDDFQREGENTHMDARQPNLEASPGELSVTSLGCPKTRPSPTTIGNSASARNFGRTTYLPPASPTWEKYDYFLPPVWMEAEDEGECPRVDKSPVETDWAPPSPSPGAGQGPPSRFKFHSESPRMPSSCQQGVAGVSEAWEEEMREDGARGISRTLIDEVLRKYCPLYEHLQAPNSSDRIPLSELIDGDKAGAWGGQAEELVAEVLAGYNQYLAKTLKPLFGNQGPRRGGSSAGGCPRAPPHLNINTGTQGAQDPQEVPNRMPPASPGHSPSNISNETFQENVEKFYNDQQKAECPRSLGNTQDYVDDTVDRMFEREVDRFYHAQQNESGISSGGSLSRSPRFLRQVADDSIDQEFNEEIDRFYAQQQNESVSSGGCPRSPGSPRSPRYVADDSIDRQFNAEIDRVYRAQQQGDTTLSSGYPLSPASRGIPDDTIDRLFQEEVDRHYNTQQQNSSLGSPMCPRSQPQGGSCPRGGLPRSPRPQPQLKAKPSPRLPPGSPRSPNTTMGRRGQGGHDRTYTMDESYFPPFVPSALRHPEDTLDMIYNEEQRKFEAIIPQNNQKAGAGCPRKRPPMSPAARPPLSPLRTPTRQEEVAACPRRPRTPPQSPNATQLGGGPSNPRFQLVVYEVLSKMLQEANEELTRKQQLNTSGSSRGRPVTPPARPQQQGQVCSRQPLPSPPSPNDTIGSQFYQELDEVYNRLKTEGYIDDSLDFTEDSGKNFSPPASPHSGSGSPRWDDTLASMESAAQPYFKNGGQRVVPVALSPTSPRLDHTVDSLFAGMTPAQRSPNKNQQVPQLEAHLIRRASDRGPTRPRPPTPLSPPSEMACPRRSPSSPQWNQRQPPQTIGMPSMVSTPLEAPRREDVRRGGNFFDFSPETVDLYRRHDELLRRHSDMYRRQYGEDDSRGR